MDTTTKVAVVGVGKFGENHARIYDELPGAELIGVYDLDPAHSAEVAARHGCRNFLSLDELGGAVQAASVAVPTDRHAEVATKLLAMGIDVLVEKPIARTLSEADAIIAAASRHNRLVQVGHLERFNPAVEAACAAATVPLFFEAHRLSPFSPRSLDVDVVMDLMIHDLDIVLSLVKSEPEEIRGVGLAVLSQKFDIASVRVAFENGCVANFTASRVSTERVRKLRWFQPGEYVSVDYDRQDAYIIAVGKTPQGPALLHKKLEPARDEPLRRQLGAFLNNVRQRSTPKISGVEGRRAVALAHQILGEMKQHADRLKTRNPVSLFDVVKVGPG